MTLTPYFLELNIEIEPCSYDAIRLIDTILTDPIEKIPFKKYLNHTESNKFYIAQAIAFSKAKTKFKHLDMRRFVFESISLLEQSSSDSTAIVKSNLVGQGSLAIDITGGMGIDSIFLSKHFKHFIYLEIDEKRAEFAKQNFANLSIQNIDVVCADALDYLHHSNIIFDMIYADPARRNEGTRNIGLSSYLPDLQELLAVSKSKCKKLILKLSPFISLSELKKLKHTPQYFIALENNKELKEIVAIFDFENEICNTKEVVIAEDFYIVKNIENSIKYGNLNHAQFIYQAPPSIIKQNMYGDYCKLFDVCKISEPTNLFFSIDEKYPIGKKFKVEKILNHKDKYISQIATKGVSIVSKGYPESAELIRKKLKAPQSKQKFLIYVKDVNNQYKCILADRIK